MQELMIVIVLFTTIKAAVDVSHQTIETKGKEWRPAAAVVAGLALAFGGSINVMGALVPDYPVAPFVGQLVTGFALAGGAGFLHDISKNKSDAQVVELEGIIEDEDQ